MYNENDNKSTNIVQILDTIPACIYWKSIDGAYLWCNQYALNIANCQSQDIIGKTDFELPWADDAQQLQTNDNLVIETGYFEGDETCTLNNQKKTMKTIKIRLLDSNSNPYGIFGVSMDVSPAKAILSQKKRQMILNQENAHTQVKGILEEVLKHIPGHVYWKDVHGIYLGSNDNQAISLGFQVGKDLIGKTDFELPWPEGSAEQFRNHDLYVIKNGCTIAKEEISWMNGKETAVISHKAPLRDKSGNTIGTIGISLDITAQKEQEKLTLENQAQAHKISAEEQLKFRELVGQLNHDIRSPLTSLKMLTKQCAAFLPEKERNAYTNAISRITDIANNMMNYFKPEDNTIDLATEEAPEKMLVSTALREILTEKRYEYGERNIKFSKKFPSTTNFAFINIAPRAFKRMISNIINNGVDAIENNTGEIAIALELNKDNLVIIIKDNGKGMPLLVKNAILKNIKITNGKKNGHGLGFMQIRETLQKSNGTLSIKSSSKSGTTISLTFPKATSPTWLLEKIEINHDDLIVVLDDDPSIHEAWDGLFKNESQNLQLKHFENGHNAIEFINSLSPTQKQKILLLTDYELLHQDLNGLNVVSETNVERSILVTSHYTNPSILALARLTQTKVLPKLLAHRVSINVLNCNTINANNKTDSQLKQVDLIFLDDDKELIDNFMSFVLHEYNVDVYHTPEEFLAQITHYSLDNKILIDHRFKNSQIDGLQIIEKLYKLGFKNCYLYSGCTFVKDSLPKYIKVILKTDVEAVKTLVANTQVST